MPLSGRTLTLATALTALLGLGTAGQRAPDGWQLPQNAETEANPLPATDDVLDRGRRIYESKCWRCHGPLGKGDGPEADPDRKPGDLSDPARASRNPDAIIFYKVWNGRRSPDMPAFKSELEPDDVWAVVHYVKTLRRRASFISLRTGRIWRRAVRRRREPPITLHQLENLRRDLQPSISDTARPAAVASRTSINRPVATS